MLLPVYLNTVNNMEIGVHLKGIHVLTEAALAVTVKDAKKAG